MVGEQVLSTVVLASCEGPGQRSEVPSFQARKDAAYEPAIYQFSSMLFRQRWHNAMNIVGLLIQHYIRRRMSTTTQ